MLRALLLSLTGCFILSLSACQFNNTMTVRPLTSQTIEGEWVDSHGIISTFHGGMMTTHAPDTQEKLAEGNYLLLGEGQMKIQLRSLVRGTSSLISCQASTNDTILCSPENGDPSFSLTRNKDVHNNNNTSVK